MSSTTGIILGTAGAIVTTLFGGNPYLGWSIGYAIGSYLDQPNIEGPRLTDRTVQISSYGAAIPQVYGSVRIAGNVIWNGGIAEHSTSQSSKGGPEQTSFTYSWSGAILICKGEITGIRRIWGNKRLLVDASESNQGPTYASGVYGPRIYHGTETQVADPLIAAAQGTSLAFRGYAYAVFQNLDISEHFGNRPPQFEFEVVRNGTQLDIIHDLYDTGDHAQDYSDLDSLIFVPARNELWLFTYPSPGFLNTITRVDPVSGSLIGYIDVGYEPYLPMRYDPVNQRMIVYIGGGGGQLSVIDAQSADVIRTNAVASINGIWVDPLQGTVWITTSPTSTLREIDPVTAIQPASRVFPLGVTPYDVAFDKDGLIYYNSGGDKILRRVQNPSGSVQTFTLSTTYNISFMAYDSTRHGLWIKTGGTTGEIIFWDINTQSITSTYALTGGGASFYSRIVYDSSRDVVWATNTATDKVYGINASDGSTYKSITLTDPTGPTIGMDYFFTMVAEGGDGVIKKILLDRITSSGIVLSDIVSDICDQSGLAGSDIDVTALTDTVKGFAISNQMTGRAAIEALQPAYYFDGVESDDKLKFVKRGGTVAVTIPESARGAYAAGSETVDPLSIVRGNEYEAPYECNVQYWDDERDYQFGSQYERRITRDARGSLRLDLPIVLSKQKAKEIAQVNLYLAWQRQSFRWTTGYKYSKYEPSDVVTLPTLSANYNVRISAKRELPNGIIEWEGKAEDGALYSQAGVTSADNYESQTIATPGNTLMKLMDMPILRDVDDDAGFYAAFCGVGGVWNGEQFFKSSDGGTTYGALFSTTEAATIGSASTVLDNFTGGNVFDYTNTVDVNLQNGTLASMSEVLVLNGANVALLGDEVIQFKTATLISGSAYTLSGLLRGRKGTEWAMTTHAIGERFVLVSTSTWRRAELETTEIGLSRLYKSPAFGQTISAVSPTSFTCNAVGLEPYSPVQLTGSRDGSDNITMNWIRRTRLSWDSLDAREAPLGETTEAYEVEVWDSSYTTLKRTITGITSPTTTYSAANQTTDFGSVQNPVYLKVFQLSSVVGRGYELRGTV